ncbi:MAG: MFS transporter [Actinomycetota bacterium]|nr:MFS transporter [Actinomycetota bacterium]
MTARLPSDARRILTAQALRAFAYGFGAVLLGVTLAQRGYSSTEVGLVLTTVVVGTVIASMSLARYADRVGRRRCYVTMYLLLVVVGAVFSSPAPLWLLIVVSLSGALSTDVVESGPFTSLEQPMLATALAGTERLGGFGRYNAVATAGGSLGALAAGLPALVHHWSRAAPPDQRWFLLFVPVAAAGALVATTLSAAVEAPAPASGSSGPAGRLGRSRPTVYRLCGLFALDSFGGGFVIQAFVAYWFSTRFKASIGVVGLVFFASGLLQTASFLVAIRLGDRFGLLRTMVFTHLPSNVLLAAVAFAPALGVAVGLWLARVCLSQMDVPARQAYLMALVDPAEQTAAAAYTNTARYVTKPLGPVLAGAAQSVAPGLPFVFAGSIKAVYDVVLWRWFRHVPIPDAGATGSPSGAQLPFPSLDRTTEEEAP